MKCARLAFRLEVSYILMNFVSCENLPFHQNEESDGHTDNYCYQ